MSQFISLRILASIGLGRSKKTSNRETPGAPPVVERHGERCKRRRARRADERVAHQREPDSRPALTVRARLRA